MTSVITVDIPCTNANKGVAGLDSSTKFPDGKVRRRVLIFINGTSENTSHADVLTAWVPDLADIEGIVYGTVDDAYSTTATPLTWSTTTLTYANHTGAGKQEICLIGRYT